MDPLLHACMIILSPPDPPFPPAFPSICVLGLQVSQLFHSNHDEALALCLEGVFLGLSNHYFDLLHFICSVV